jgi:hypothetical protein
MEERSIEHLENDYWKDIDFPTPLVEKCYAYRKIPVKDLSIEQLRILLGQTIGTKYLLPKALSCLQEDMLAEGDFYPGDLLNAVLHLPQAVWNENADALKEFHLLVKNNRDTIEATSDKKLIREMDNFISRHEFI